MWYVIPLLNICTTLSFVLFRYQLHLDWARGVLQGQGLDEDSIEKTLKKYTDPVELECAGSTSKNEQMDCCAAADRGQAEGSTHHSDGDLEPSDSELQSGSPERKKPRRQGDLQYDPLADIYPEEPAVLDKEALSTVKCHKHDDLIMHCGCRLKDSVIDDMLSNATAPPTPSFTPGHEYVLVQEDEENPCDSVNINTLQLHFQSRITVLSGPTIFYI